MRTYIIGPKASGPKPSESARIPFMAPSASPSFEGGTFLKTRQDKDEAIGGSG